MTVAVKPVRVAIDLDGVVADFNGRAVELIRQTFPSFVIPEDFRPSSWNWWRELGMLSGEWEKVLDSIQKTPWFWTTLEPTKEAGELEKLLASDPSLNVLYVTSRWETEGGSVEQQSALWLMKHGLWAEDGRTSIIRAPKPETKAAIVEASGQLALLDDSPEVVMAVDHRLTIPVLLDRSWNRDATVAVRVSSIEEFVELARYYRKLREGLQ